MNRTNPFVSKSVEASSTTGLWPESISEHSSLSRGRFPNYMLFSNTPQWQNLTSLKSLFDCFHRNPVLFATVMIKAREYSNMRIKVVSRSNAELIEPETTRKDIPAKIYSLFNKPNILQSRWEWLMQRKIFEEVAGNTMTYANSTIGKKVTIQSVQALWNVWPAYMSFILAGGYFEATEMSDIVKQWKFELGTYKKTWEPHEIMHKNKPNTEPHDGLIFGRSAACSLTRPLSNIEMAYEARNVLMRNRGMRVIATSAKSDASGLISLQEDEKEIVNDAIKDYGILEGQTQFFFSHVPLTVTPIDQDVRKLGLFEEIATDAMVVANAYGVPEILVKLYLQGATFANQEASVRRLYQGTLIPEAEDDMIAFNNFLGLTDTDWKIVPDFSHVAALQESEKIKAETEAKEKEIAMKEYAAGLISVEEYRIRMGYKPRNENETFVSDGKEDSTAEAKDK